MLLSFLLFALPISIGLIFLAFASLILNEMFSDPPAPLPAGATVQAAKQARVPRTAVCDPHCREESSVRLPVAARNARQRTRATGPESQVIGWH